MQGEMQVLTSPLGHKRTPSDISMISLESVTSSVSPEEKKDGEEGEKEVMCYTLMLMTEFGSEEIVILCYKLPADS